MPKKKKVEAQIVKPVESVKPSEHIEMMDHVTTVARETLWKAGKNTYGVAIVKDGKVQIQSPTGQVLYEKELEQNFARIYHLTKPAIPFTKPVRRFISSTKEGLVENVIRLDTVTERQGTIIRKMDAIIVAPREITKIEKR